MSLCFLFFVVFSGFSYLQVSGCQAVFNKSATIPFSDYRFLNVYIPELGYNKFLSPSQAIYLINLPRNKKIVFYLTLDNQNTTFTFIAKTPSKYKFHFPIQHLFPGFFPLSIFILVKETINANVLLHYISHPK